MGNYYDPEHHDIWGDSEDDQLYQKAPRASVSVISSRLINAAYKDDDMPSSDEKHDTSFTDTNYTSPVQTTHMPRQDTIWNSLMKTKPLDTVAASANIGGLAQDTAKVRTFPESDNMADNSETLRSPETGVGLLIKDTGGIPASYYAADAHRSDGLRPERGWMGRNRLTEDAPPRARFVPRPNMPPTAVRSAPPRPDNDNQQPDTTDMTENNMTAVRSLAPRPWHTTVRLNGTTPWRQQPLCTIGSMTHIILLLLHNGDGGVEPCSPPANSTNLTSCQNTVTHDGMANGRAERCSPPTTSTITTVRSPAPRPCHYPDHTVNAMYDSTKEPHQQLGIHPQLNITPLPLHIPQRSRTRNCRNTAFSHCSTPPSQSHLAWHCRSVIVSGARSPVCLPATGSVTGIKHALHHLTPHLPPPHDQWLFYQEQPLGDNDPTPTSTAHGPIHLALRLVVSGV